MFEKIPATRQPHANAARGPSLRRPRMPHVSHMRIPRGPSLLMPRMPRAHQMKINTSVFEKGHPSSTEAAPPSAVAADPPSAVLDGSRSFLGRI